MRLSRKREDRKREDTNQNDRKRKFKRKGLNFAQRLWLKHLVWGVPFTIAVGLTTLTVFLKIFGANFSEKILFSCSIIFSVAAYAMFLFSLYAICCGKNNNNLKNAIAIIFFIYAGITLLGGIVLIIEKNNIIDQIQKMINDPKVSDSSKHQMENLCHCSCTQSCKQENPGRGKCEDVIVSYLNKLTKGGAVGIAVLAFVLILTGVLLIKDAKQSQNNNEVNFEDDQREDYQPID